MPLTANPYELARHDRDQLCEKARFDRAFFISTVYNFDWEVSRCAFVK
ncbi:hypothetical protein CEV34_0129 [Brucella pseudogrignonensis]|uniref:Uncharacterized protein n=1 Tax=Brucella pseudogrignonensis TaxID=419475 RepID=A0A256GVK2_9HYPH|nr:hypothetical protein CEV34_0129 [Brucella pseudogrignonensis]